MWTGFNILSVLHLDEADIKFTLFLKLIAALPCKISTFSYKSVQQLVIQFKIGAKVFVNGKKTITC